MPLGRPLSPLTLLSAERQQLLDWTRRPKTAQALALRARIVLSSAAGLNNTEVARRVHVSLATVGKWRQRFLRLRLDGLLDEPRPGTPRRSAMPRSNACWRASWKPNRKPPPIGPRARWPGPPD